MIKGEGAESKELNSYGAKYARVEARDRILAMLEHWTHQTLPPSEPALAMMQIRALVNLAQTVEALNHGSA